MPPTLPLSSLLLSSPRASSSSIAALGIISTETIESDAEQRGQQQHRRKAEHPAEQPGQPGADHVAGMVERLVMSVLPVEPGLANHAERDAGDRRSDRRTGDRGRDLRQRHQPETLRQQYDAGSESPCRCRE